MLLITGLLECDSHELSTLLDSLLDDVFWANSFWQIEFVILEDRFCGVKISTGQIAVVSFFFNIFRTTDP